MYPDLETFFTATTQIEIFLISCAIGIVLGAIYDIFRILRIVLPHTNLLTTIEDILLMTAYGIFLMCFAFSLMRGQIRVFFMIGNFLGFMLWFFTIGTIINRVALRLKKYILKFIDILILPFKKLIPIFKKVLKNLTKNSRVSK